VETTFLLTLLITFLERIVVIAIALATLNIVGGFSVTGRILQMFKKND